MPRPTVAVLAYPGMSAFETGIVTEVFGLPRPALDVEWYQLKLCAAGPVLFVHRVRGDFGRAVPTAVARGLVIPPHRDGGQAQFIEAPVTADPDDDRIARSMTWAVAHLAQPITVAALARVAHMSTRSYLRHFARCSGTSPIRWLIAQRVQASLPLLEAGYAPGGEVGGRDRVGRPAPLPDPLSPATYPHPPAPS